MVGNLAHENCGSTVKEEMEVDKFSLLSGTTWIRTIPDQETGHDSHKKLREGGSQDFLNRWFFCVAKICSPIFISFFCHLQKRSFPRRAPLLLRASHSHFHPTFWVWSWGMPIFCSSVTKGQHSVVIIRDGDFSKTCGRSNVPEQKIGFFQSITSFLFSTNR